MRIASPLFVPAERDLEAGTGSGTTELEDGSSTSLHKRLVDSITHNAKNIMESVQNIPSAVGAMSEIPRRSVQSLRGVRAREDVGTAKREKNDEKGEWRAEKQWNEKDFPELPSTLENFKNDLEDEIDEKLDDKLDEEFDEEFDEKRVLLEYAE
jgi:hypothetical protein